jgi:hypothetical protein
MQAMFLGGPMDGLQMVLPTPQIRWYFAAPPPGLLPYQAQMVNTVLPEVIQKDEYELTMIHNKRALYRYVGRV